MTNHRIRVLVAGDIYANRTLIRPFLEDDGYEVVGEISERAELVPAVSGTMPDALVVGEALVAGRRGGKALRRIRRAAPDAKVVVVTAAPSAAAFSQADATLETGLSLAWLTALLGRLFAERTPRATVPAGVIVGAGAVAAHRDAGSSEPRGSVARFVASVGVPLVVVWGLIALVTSGGGVVLPRADTTDLAAGGVVVVPMTDGPLASAQDSLGRLLHAIRAGNPVLATLHARALIDARASAIAFGYPTGELDADVESGLAAVVGLLSPGATGTLAGILGDLFPDAGAGSPSPGGGSGIVLGPATGSDGTGSILTSAGRGNPDGIGPDNEGEGDGIVVVPGPGDGKAWEQSHKASRQPGGGPPPWAKGKGPPPWARGHGHDGDVSVGASGHAQEHGRGHAYGHDKDGRGKHKGRDD